MSDAIFQRTEILQGPAQARESRPWPIGLGLLIGAAASVRLWGAIFWSLGHISR